MSEAADVFMASYRVFHYDDSHNDCEWAVERVSNERLRFVLWPLALFEREPFERKWNR